MLFPIFKNRYKNVSKYGTDGPNADLKCKIEAFSKQANERL